jgi:16S rRNA (cytidine1402-2'-O)-methyltransferase
MTLSKTGTLYVVGTPIGNLGDLSPRALEILGSVTVIAAEDTRVVAKLLARGGLSTPTTALHEHNSARAVPALMERLVSGQDIALVSDAGTPAISDPGTPLVAACHAAGISVSPIPGPSALTAAVSACGLSGDGLRFEGFLPRSGRKRKERLLRISVDESLVVLYESPHRLAETLDELVKHCPGRMGAVARELTKIHEEIVVGPIEELAQRFKGPTLGEIVLVLAGVVRKEEEAEEEDADERLGRLVRAELDKGRSAKDTAAALAAALGVSKKRVYDLAVEQIALIRESGD